MYFIFQNPCETICKAMNIIIVYYFRFINNMLSGEIWCDFGIVDMMMKKMMMMMMMMMVSIMYLYIYVDYYIYIYI